MKDCPPHVTGSAESPAEKRQDKPWAANLFPQQSRFLPSGQALQTPPDTFFWFVSFSPKEAELH